ncbi:MAG: iron complex outermembrane recepter protein [Gallionellaceae bacterium]|nr:MAG: iron complex outermembrane recepter protein [Gallionellaceae bacterium]
MGEGAGFLHKKMMKTKSSTTPKLFLLSFIAIAPVAALAEEDGKQLSLDEVVVTATRTGVTASDAPAAVTVVKASDIQNKNASRLGDALDQVPSLYLRGGALGQSQGTVGTSGMSLRGIDQTRTLVLLDGQPIQDAATGKVNWRTPFMEDIERVEVVPGAFSSLYGSNAIGGVVNIITKQPDTHELTAKVKKGWGDASGEDASLYFRDKMKNGLGFAGGIGRQIRDSYVNDFIVKASAAGVAGTPVTGAQAITTREGVPTYLVGDLGKTPWHATNATAKLFYDLNSRDKIFAGINHQETRVGYTQFNSYLSNAATGASVTSGTLGINGQRVVWANSDFAPFSSLPLHEASTRYFIGYDGSIGSDYLLKVDLARIDRAYDFSAAGATALWNSGTGSWSDTPNSGIDGTAQLSFPLSDAHFMVTGLAFHKDVVNQKIYTLSNWRDPATKTALSSGYNGHSSTTSVFVQDEFSATEALKVYVGGRWDDWRAQGDNFVITPVSSTSYAERHVAAFSPKVSATYKPIEALVLRTSFGRSFRAPTNQDLYSSSTSRGRTTTGDPNLQPERADTLEVGGEWRASAAIKLTATVYETRLSNLIYVKQVTTVAPLLSQRINAGKARVRGAELGASHQLTSWLAVDANYAYIDSRILENAADPLSVGKRLTDAPRNIIGIGVTAQRGDWSGSLNARYVSHIFWNAQNTDVVEGVPGSYDAHTMVNAKIGYAFTKVVKGSVAINNLLDTKAYSYFLLPRRNLTAELDFSF